MPAFDKPAFDIYSYVTGAAGLKAGDVITLPYKPGRTAAKYRPSGKRTALGPNEQDIVAPGEFTTAFNAPSIAITWAAQRVPPAAVVKFQFEVVDGLMGSDGYEIAHANADNIDFTSVGGPFAPINSPVFIGNPSAPTPPLHDNDTSIATTAFVQGELANSPALGGVPTAPTPADNDNTTKIATTAFVMREVADLIGSAPATLDTLGEISAALAADPNFSTTILNQLALKAPLDSPIFTGTVTAPALNVTGATTTSTLNVTGAATVGGQFNANGTLIIAKSIYVAGTPATHTLTGDVNDYAPPGFADAAVIRMTATGTVTITGLAGGTHGRRITLQNMGVQNIFLSANNVLSASANRFRFLTQRWLASLASIELIYDQNFGQWFEHGMNGLAVGPDIRIGTANDLAITPGQVYSAVNQAVVVYSATLTLDFSLGINFLVPVNGNIVLANPTNAKLGQSGRIALLTDATPGRLISYGSWWQAPGGAQAISATANSLDCLYYFVRDSVSIEYTLLKRFIP